MATGNCIRRGKAGAKDDADYDEPGKPSCTDCFAAFAKVPGDDTFPEWNAKNPLPAEPPRAPQVVSGELEAIYAALKSHSVHESGESAQSILRRVLETRATAVHRVAELETQLATAIQAKTNFGDICGERDALRRKVAELESDVFKLRGDLVRAQGRGRRPW